MFPAPYALVALAYLLGAVPFGLLISLVFAKRDVREVGSGNIGATNVVRAAGRWAGLATLLLDMAKGIAPTWLALHYFGLEWAVVTGAAAFLGHLFPVYLGFRGGKGVATGFGVFVVIAPWAGAGGPGHLPDRLEADARLRRRIAGVARHRRGHDRLAQPTPGGLPLRRGGDADRHAPP